MLKPIVDRIALYKRAIEKWGKPAQLDMIEEECAELIVELKRWRRGRNSTDDVCGEIADVEIMCEQARLMFDRNLPDGESTIDFIKQQKLRRLLERLNG